MQRTHALMPLAAWQRTLFRLGPSFGAVLLALLIPEPCWAWGGAHRYIRRWAVQRLPDQQAAFVGAAALARLHEKYTSLQDTHAGGNAPHLDPYCMVPGVRLSLHDVNPPGPTRAGMEWYFERIIEHLRKGRNDADHLDRAMKYLGVLCHWCEDPGSLSAHSSPVSEHVLRQLIPPPRELQNRNYLYGYGWIGLEANVGLEDPDYQPELIGGTVSQAAARLTHLQQRLQRHSAGLIVPAILAKVQNDTERFEAACATPNNGRHSVCSGQALDQVQTIGANNRCHPPVYDLPTVLEFSQPQPFFCHQFFCQLHCPLLGR